MSQYITAGDQALMFIQNLLVDGWVSKSACFLDHEDILYPDFDHDHHLSLPLLWHDIVVGGGNIPPKGNHHNPEYEPFNKWLTTDQW